MISNRYSNRYSYLISRSSCIVMEQRSTTSRLTRTDILIRNRIQLFRRCSSSCSLCRLSSNRYRTSCRKQRRLVIRYSSYIIILSYLMIRIVSRQLIQKVISKDKNMGKKNQIIILKILIRETHNMKMKWNNNKSSFKNYNSYINNSRNSWMKTSNLFINSKILIMK